MMTPKEPMKSRTIRETDEVWDAVAATAEENYTDTATVTREFWRKYGKKKIDERRKQKRENTK